MAGSAGSIYVDLLLRDGRYRDGLRQSKELTKTWERGVRQSTRGAEGAFTAVINPVTNMNEAIARLGVTVASVFSVTSIVNYSDTWKQLEGRLGLVVDSQEELASVQNRLFEIAKRTRQPLESITNLYSRMGQIIPENLQANLDLLGVTEAVATSLAITGESSLSAQAAIVQFTQALATDFEAAGQEIRSIQEQAPRLAVALTRALGDGSQSLRQLVDEGKVSVEAIGQAFREGQPEFERLRLELEKIAPTTRQAFTALNNAFLEYIGLSDAASAGTNAIALAVRTLADNLSTVINLLVFTSTVIGTGFLAKGLKTVTTSASNFISTLKETSQAQKTLTASAIAYNAEVQRSAGATAFWAQSAGKSERVSQSLAKQQLALNGSFSKTAIIVDSAGNAVKRSGIAASIASKAWAGFLALNGPLVLGILAVTAATSFLINETTAGEKAAEEYEGSLLDLGDQSNLTSLELISLRDSMKADEADKLSEKISNLESELEELNDELERGRIGGWWEWIVNIFDNLNSRLQTYVKLSQAIKTFNVRGVIESTQDFGSPTNNEFVQEELANINSIIQSDNASVESLQTAKDNLKFLKEFFPQYTEEIKKYESVLIGSIEKQRELAKLQGELSFVQTGVPIPGTKPSTIPTTKTSDDALKEFEKQQKKLNSTFRRYEDIITGVSKEELSRRDVIAQLTSLLGTEYIPNQEALNDAIARYDEQLKEAQKSTSQWDQFSQEAAKNIQGAFADFLFDPFEDGVAGMAEGFARAIQRMLAEAAAADLMRVLFGNDVEKKGISGGGGLLSSAVSGLGDFFGGFFADGGFLEPGKVGIVGEQGPELIYGGNSGKTIVPMTNTKMGGDIINIDARGAGPGVGEEIRRVMMEVTALRKDVPGLAVSAVSNANKRNPRYL